MLAHLSSVATMSARHFSVLIFQMRNLRLRELKVLPGKSHNRARIPTWFSASKSSPFPRVLATLASYFSSASCEHSAMLWGRLGLSLPLRGWLGRES